jgi:hypothetical protein
VEVAEVEADSVVVEVEEAEVGAGKKPTESESCKMWQLAAKMTYSSW